MTKVPKSFREHGTLHGDVNGGLTGALLSVSTTIGFGIVLFAPYGAAGVGVGIVAVLIGQVLGGVIGTFACGTRGLSLGTTSTMTLLLAGLIASVAAEHPGSISIALGAVALATVMSGLLLTALAALGAGKLIPLVPYPVLAGIVNGTAVLLIISMLPRAIGVGPVDATGFWLPIAPFISTTVIGLILLEMPKILSKVPAVMIAVLSGTAVHHLLALVVGMDHAGPMLGAMPSIAAGRTSDLRQTMDALEGIDLTRLAIQILPVAVSMALVTMIESLAAVSALQDSMGRVAHARRDLIATGIANIVTGFAGGAAVTGNVAATITITRAGGTTWVSLFLRCVFLLLFMVVLAPALAFVPMAAMAGVVIAIGWRLLDLDGLTSAWRMLRHGGRNRVDIMCSALVILVVAGVAIRWSLVEAVGVGIPLSVVVFVVSMGRDLVRRSYRNPIGRSRLRWPENETSILIAGGGRVAVVEIQGAIFFGSVDTLAHQIATELSSGADFVVLDMRQITSIDLSGARRLVQICNSLWQQRVNLSLAYVRPGMAIWDYLEELALLDRLRKEHVFPTLDTALEAVETALLVESGAATTLSLTPEAALHGLGLPEEAVAALLPHLAEVHFAADDIIIRAGEETQSVYLLLSGRLDVTIPLTTSSTAIALRTRLTTITAGTLVGEMALLSGAPRSADVISRTSAVCLRFDADMVAALRRERPEVAYQLLMSITLQIDRNLRLANLTIASLES